MRSKLASLFIIVAMCTAFVIASHQDESKSEKNQALIDSAKKVLAAAEKRNTDANALVTGIQGAKELDQLTAAWKEVIKQAGTLKSLEIQRAAVDPLPAEGSLKDATLGTMVGVLERAYSEVDRWKNEEGVKKPEDGEKTPSAQKEEVKKLIDDLKIQCELHKRVEDACKGLDERSGKIVGDHHKSANHSHAVAIAVAVPAEVPDAKDNSRAERRAQAHEVLKLGIPELQGFLSKHVEFQKLHAAWKEANDADVPKAIKDLAKLRNAYEAYNGTVESILPASGEGTLEKRMELVRGGLRDTLVETTDSLRKLLVTKLDDRHIDPFLVGAGYSAGGVRANEAKGYCEALATMQNAHFDERLERVRKRGGEVRVEVILLQNQLTLFNEGLAYDMGDWVHDQVRLFYFANVPRLLQTLSRNTQLVNPEGLDIERQAREARESMLNAQAAVEETRYRISAMARNVIELENELGDARRRHEAAVRTKARADSRVAELDQRIARLDDRKTALEKQRDAAQKEEDKAKFQASLDELTTQKAALVKEKSIAELGKTDAATAVTAANESKEEIEAEDSATQKAIREARRLLSDAQAELIRQRILATALGQREVEDFARSSANAPFYVSKPIIGSTDPVANVVLFAYPDSNFLFVRGPKEHVETVKEIVAAFDRPAPQARITLYELQVNSHDNATGERVLSQVDGELRNLRATIGFVQDALRNSITKEVGRAAHVARSAMQGVELEDRCWRYFYYPEEIRKRLGFDPVIGQEALVSQEVAYDLEVALDAVEEAQLIDASKDSAAIRRSRTARKRYLLGVAYDAAHAAMVAMESWQRVRRSRFDPFGFGKLLTIVKEHVNRAKKVGDLYAASDAQLMDVAELTDESVTELRDEIARLRNNRASLFNDSTVTLSGKRPSHQDQASLGQAQYITRWTLPDPVHSTTLGEMLFVISLGTESSRNRIILDFRRELFTMFPNMQPPGGDSMAELVNAFAEGILGGMGGRSNKFGGYPYLPAALLGSISPRTSSDQMSSSLTSNQLEALLAMEARAKENVSSEVLFLLEEIDKRATGILEREPDAMASGILERDPGAMASRTHYWPLLLWLLKALNPVLSQAGPDVLPEAGSIQEFLARSPGGVAEEATVSRVMSLLKSSQGPTGIAFLDLDRLAWQMASTVHKQNSLARATPRVAAADDMLKRLIVVAENDLEHFFISQALENIRGEVAGNKNRGIELGSFKRTSILATNRLVARVDPRATADLELAQGTDFLAAATQLGQIGQSFAASSLAPGLATSSLGLGAQLADVPKPNPLSIAGALSLFDILTAQPTQPDGEIYSINSGSLFKVTPVFDPSGQALRFKFDYQASIDVREPNGTTNRQLARVERHAVNTEVQLTNLEFREIGRFEANTQIGLPPQRSGGIPLVREVPFLKDIPILGYYYRRAPVAAKRQHSLIFAQTSIYPTVGDIVDLLVQAPPKSIVAPRMPSYLRPDQKPASPR